MSHQPNQHGLRPVVGRQTIQDQVYGQLREALIAGAFEARDSLKIDRLAQRFQVSHMPVREALRRLAAENALRISPTGTAYVPDLSPDELSDITRARMIIEGAVAEIAFPRLGPADADLLGTLMARHLESGLAGDLAAMTEANRGFHFHIYRAAGSPVLLGQIENLWLRSGPYVRILSDRVGTLLKGDLRAAFTRFHEKALDALRAGDGPGFRAAIEGDIWNSHLRLRDLVSADGGGAVPAPAVGG